MIRFDGQKKSFEIDDKKSLRLPKKNRYPVVLFEPDDLHLVGSSPSRRRDYFDEFFKQIDANYGVADIVRVSILVRSVRSRSFVDTPNFCSSSMIRSPRSFHLTFLLISL